MDQLLSMRCPDCDTNCYHCWKDLSKQQKKCCPDCKCSSHIKLLTNSLSLAVSKPFKLYKIGGDGK